MNTRYNFVKLFIPVFIFIQLPLLTASGNEILITKVGKADISSGKITTPVPSIRTNNNLNKRQQVIKFITDMDNKREHLRINAKEMSRPLILTTSQKDITLIDISRGGVGLRHNNTLKQGGILPVQITYGDRKLKTEIEIISATSSRAGAKFLTKDITIANEILYLSVMLEADNNMLLTKLSK